MKRDLQICAVGGKSRISPTLVVGKNSNGKSQFNDRHQTPGYWPQLLFRPGQEVATVLNAQRHGQRPSHRRMSVWRLTPNFLCSFRQ
jgi:hypothetical protein